MNNIKIKTLTPIHVGSGIELQGNFEYLYFKDEQKVAVVDAEKVLAILGEENLPQWVACIDNNKSLLPVLEKRSKNLRAADVAVREIPLSIATDKPIREQIHSGGKPLIPGSSLKGAIRTTIWATWILDNPKVVKDHRNLKNFRGMWSDESVAKTIFGSDPNHDIFRLLQVGDIEFETTRAYKTDVINKYGNNWRLKQEIMQFVEAIPAHTDASLRINYNDLLLKQPATRNYFNQNKNQLELERLFPLINHQTGRLVNSEIKYWDTKQGNPEALGDYVEEMERLSHTIDTCAANECVLRLGWGSGFRSMTGDWHDAMTDDDYYRMVKTLRPKHPDDLVFPKTTRFVTGGMPLGFIKMSF